MTTTVNVLIVDDRAGNRQALAALLETMEVNAICLDSGEAALRYLLKGEAAVILLDVDMPGMDGFETAKVIRERERTRAVPIVFVTGLDAGREQAIRGYDLGAVDYLVKPVIPEVLRAKVGVFVELSHYRERLQTVAEELKQEREMSSAWLGHERNSQGFNGMWEAGLQKALERDYRQTLQAQVENGGLSPKDHDRSRALAQRIARAGGGPKELLTVHRKVTETIMAKALPKQARPLRDRCRLLTLELMGHLADYYRNEASRRPDHRPDHRPEERRNSRPAHGTY